MVKQSIITPRINKVSQRNLKKVLQNERREENNDQQTKFLVIKVLSKKQNNFK